MTLYPQVLRNRPRLVLGLVTGVLVAVLIPAPLRGGVRLLIGWDCAVWAYLLLMWIEMARAHHKRVREVAIREDKNATIVLFVTCVATVASVAAIIAELAMAKNSGFVDEVVHYALTAITLFGAWFLIPTTFALHYARLYYTPNAGETALGFPERDIEPDYWDFLYFAFTIAVASQTSDVVLRSREIRRAALAQSILSFYFNVAVLGLCVNFAAGMLNSR
jgi:uncharacterized membrane protein